MEGERALDDRDGAVHAGAEAARLGEDDFQSVGNCEAFVCAFPPPRSPSQRRSATPTVMAESATLNAGQ